MARVEPARVDTRVETKAVMAVETKAMDTPVKAKTKAMDTAVKAKTKAVDTAVKAKTKAAGGRQHHLFQIHQPILLLCVAMTN